MLRRTYDWIMLLSSKPGAIYALGGISFLESSVLPLPPDPLLITMSLKKTDKTFHFTFLCTLMSVLGGLVGYLIGWSFFQTLGQGILKTYGLEAGFHHFQAQFESWGFWLIVAKGLTPIPYKVVTIACGVLHFDLFQFVVASLIARAMRFYSLAFLLRRYGKRIEAILDRYLTPLAFIFLILLVGGVAAIIFF